MSLTNDQITAQNFSDFYNKISPYLGIAHAGFTPVGALVIMTGNEVPANHLACDGTVYNISAYPELAAYYARSQGACNFYGGDGTTTFAVPDLRGEFIRGAGNNSHTGNGNGASVGVHQDATKEYLVFPNVSALSYYAEATKTPENTDTTASSTHTRANINKSTSASVTGTESFTSRPTNTSFLICVAAKNIFNDVGNNYSLEEQEVGTWVDGKKLYQRTFKGSALSNIVDGTISAFNIDTGFSSGYFDYVEIFKASALSSSKTVSMNLNDCYLSGTTTYFIRASLELVSSAETIVVRSNRSAFNGYTPYITLRYTKTTD